MSCTQMPRTSSRLEMINMEVSNNSNYEDIPQENNNCIPPPDNIYQNIVNFLNNIKELIEKNYNTIYGNFLHIYCIIVFEILFYFNYIVYVEKEEIQKVLKLFASNINDYFGDYIENIPGNDLDNFEEFCNNLDYNYVNKNNENLKDSSYNFIWTLSIILLIIILFHFKIVCDKRKFIAKTSEAIIFISFISLFEYYFFTDIVKRYNILTQEQATCYLFDNIFK